MNLHRVRVKADWEYIEAAQRNRWQRLAAKTHGVLTPANVMTLCGLGLVLLSFEAVLRHEYVQGLVLIIAGRLADVVDGWIADKTGTKSVIGEMLDATIDKVVTFLALIVLAIVQVAPVWMLILLAIPHIGITLIAFIGRQQQKRFHPSRVGKLSMFTMGISLGGFLVAHITASIVLSSLSMGVGVLSCVLGAVAARGYIREVIE